VFLVDDDMRTSDKLPTVVDYTNILVNHIEVSYDDVHDGRDGSLMDRIPRQGRFPKAKGELNSIQYIDKR
jgi:hypothetical protein